MPQVPHAPRWVPFRVKRASFKLVSRALTTTSWCHFVAATGVKGRTLPRPATPDNGTALVKPGEPRPLLGDVVVMRGLLEVVRKAKGVFAAAELMDLSRRRRPALACTLHCVRRLTKARVVLGANPAHLAERRRPTRVRSRGLVLAKAEHGGLLALVDGI